MCVPTQCVLQHSPRSSGFVWLVQRACASEQSDSRRGKRRATGFSACVWLSLAWLKTLTIGNSPTGHRNTSHYTTQGMPEGCRTSAIAESMSSVNIIDLPPSTNNSTNNPAKPIGVQSDVERGVNKDAHISMPQPLSVSLVLVFDKCSREIARDCNRLSE